MLISPLLISPLKLTRQCRSEALAQSEEIRGNDQGKIVVGSYASKKENHMKITTAVLASILAMSSSMALAQAGGGAGGGAAGGGAAAGAAGSAGSAGSASTGSTGSGTSTTGTNRGTAAGTSPTV